MYCKTVPVSGKVLALLVFLLFLPAITVYAQEEITEDITDGVRGKNGWLGVGVETAMYTIYGNVPIGASLAIGYGRGAALGIKTAFIVNPEDRFSILELTFLLRFYFLSRDAVWGPFIQFHGGPAFLFLWDYGFSFPAEWGTLSAGLDFGWRFLLSNTFYLEASIRGGYPYIVGAEFSAGFSF